MEKLFFVFLLIKKIIAFFFFPVVPSVWDSCPVSSSVVLTRRGSGWVGLLSRLPVDSAGRPGRTRPPVEGAEAGTPGLHVLRLQGRLVA